MSDHVYKILEIVGSSKQGSDQAVQNAVARAAKTLKHLAWFEVMETRGHLEGGKIAHWQVKVKIGFRLED
jgi:flavin-binding protein dodecin